MRFYFKEPLDRGNSFGRGSSFFSIDRGNIPLSLQVPLNQGKSFDRGASIDRRPRSTKIVRSTKFLRSINMCFLRSRIIIVRSSFSLPDPIDRGKYNDRGKSFDPGTGCPLIEGKRDYFFSQGPPSIEDSPSIDKNEFFFDRGRIFVFLSRAFVQGPHRPRRIPRSRKTARSINMCFSFLDRAISVDPRSKCPSTEGNTYFFQGLPSIEDSPSLEKVSLIGGAFCLSRTPSRTIFCSSD